MSQRVSTAGMSLQYAVEETAGVKPTTGWKIIPEIKETPDLSVQVNAIQSTTLLEVEYHTYVAGLKDLGGSLQFTANLTDDFIDFVDEMVDEYKTAAAAGKSMWFVIVHPKLEHAVYFEGEPSPLGLGGATVDAVLETALYITPTSAPEWGDAPGLSLEP